MIKETILLKMLRDGWVPDFSEVELPPESMVKIDFKQKLWIVTMRITSPIELCTYRDGEGTGYLRLAPEDFEPRYEKELIGYGEFFIFIIPVYRFKRKEPQSRYFFPLECDAIALVNRDKERCVMVGVYTAHSPSLSIKDFDIELKKLREEASEG